MTSEELKSVLHYCPETGVFTWIKCKHTRFIGKEAGALTGGKNRGYRVIRYAGKNYYAHRLAWLYVYGTEPKTIDHINRDRSDNRISNLREASFLQNSWNRNNRPSCSGESCIEINPKTKNYRVRIKQNGVLLPLGTYNNIEEALKVRDNFFKQHRGDFGNN